jgi:hypothetical protein
MILINIFPVYLKMIDKVFNTPLNQYNTLAINPKKHKTMPIKIKATMQPSLSGSGIITLGCILGLKNLFFKGL